MGAFLSEYGLFLAKTLTFLIAALVLIGALFATARKNKQDDGTLVITAVNERIDEIRHSLQNETLPKQQFKKWLKAEKKATKEQKNQDSPLKRLFVIDFEGDIRATQIVDLKELITAIIEIATENDEVLVIIDSAGGYVHSYGLAASQLHRLKARNIRLTVSVDKCAASGGYMMACVADSIIAAPFAIVGSIGVVAQLPNFHRWMDKNLIDYELHTAGEYKRTLTLFGENTDKGREKFQQEIEETHQLFKQFIQQHRSQIDMTQVATGEHWHAIDALKYKLIDEIKTSDDFILEKTKSAQVYELSYEHKQSLSEKIAHNLTQIVENTLGRLYKMAVTKK